MVGVIFNNYYMSNLKMQYDRYGASPDELKAFENWAFGVFIYLAVFTVYFLWSELLTPCFSLMM